jgi:ferredoxin
MKTRTFIVLISVDECDARKICEHIENHTFEIGGSVQATAMDIRKNVCDLILSEDSSVNEENIEVEPLTDFMDRVNDELFNPDDYFISYVHG